jgi:glycosyltransferase involved in cell wall biosynthesis
MHPTISVMMPVYNAGGYLAEAVESILGQSFVDFEFLIVDDGSTDNSLTMLRHYAEADPRIRLTSRPNTGLVVALNEMLVVARGEFIARMDADDVAMLGRFERQLAFLRDHPEVVCVGGAFQMIDEAGCPLLKVRPPEDDSEIQELILQGKCAINHPSAIFRREAAMALGGYREEFFPAEDPDLWLRLGEEGRLANVPDVVLKYRIHAASISQSLLSLQIENYRKGSDQACDRRGIPRRFIEPEPWRPTDGPSRHKFAVMYGWWAYQEGERLAALHYGLRAIRMRPWRPEGWHLLASVALKPVPRVS